MGGFIAANFIYEGVRLDLATQINRLAITGREVRLNGQKVQPGDPRELIDNCQLDGLNKTQIKNINDFLSLYDLVTKFSFTPPSVVNLDNVIDSKIGFPSPDQYPKEIWDQLISRPQEICDGLIADGHVKLFSDEGINQPTLGNIMLHKKACETILAAYGIDSKNDRILKHLLTSLPLLTNASLLLDLFLAGLKTTLLIPKMVDWSKLIEEGLVTMTLSEDEVFNKVSLTDRGIVYTAYRFNYIFNNAPQPAKKCEIKKLVYQQPPDMAPYAKNIVRDVDALLPILRQHPRFAVLPDREAHELTGLISVINNFFYRDENFIKNLCDKYNGQEITLSELFEEVSYQDFEEALFIRYLIQKPAADLAPTYLFEGAQMIISINKDDPNIVKLNFFPRESPWYELQLADEAFNHNDTELASASYSRMADQYLNSLNPSAELGYEIASSLNITMKVIPTL